MVRATVGESALLPCIGSKDTKNVYWRHLDSTTVCDVIAGTAHLDEQDPAFKGRVVLFPLEFPKGNFSIRLSDVTLAHGGTYTCNFLYTLTPETVHLNVTGV